MAKEEATRLYNEFQSKFPLEKLKNLKLEEYTNLNREDSFCYWLETKTESLGSIWGGSAYKFGIFKISGEIKPSNKALNDGLYAWYKKYGDTRDKAYQAILSNIIIVAEAAHNKNFALIDSIDLGVSYKWKIAYLYSNMSLLNFYKEASIRYIAKKHGMGNAKKASISQIQAYLIALSHGKDLFDYSSELWNEWLESDECKKQNDKELSYEDDTFESNETVKMYFKTSPAKTFSLKSFEQNKHISRYADSLLAKPFSILTGNSGTGKTRIALKLAHYLNVLSYSINKPMEYFQVGDVINEWTVRKISDDTIYLTNEKEPKRLRPIQKDLLQEFVDFYKENPEQLAKSGNEDRNFIKELPSAKFDKYLYGFDATLRVMAKKILENQTEYIYENFTNTLLIPVGADWTDNTKILGYFNPLANDGKGEYVKSEILSFLELAKENPSIPFFLILDEMNLSHVERYFSDFLSAMESGEPILLYKKPEDCECVVPEKITLPKNLFVTGTVNIDETTYMFSPKVLDRANVIEFKPEMKDVLDNLISGASSDEQKTAESGVAEGFMELANKIRNGDVPDELKNELEKIKPVLESIYKILEKSGFEFAYRTAKEIRLYVITSYETCEDKSQFNINSVIDQQIVQKILPKIHGNKKQIGSMLADLKVELEKNKDFELSQAKVSSMIDKLEKFQYASFI